MVSANDLRGRSTVHRRQLSRIEKRIGEPGPWSGWTPTESWAALVNDESFGLGIWIPHCCCFTGGFAGKPGRAAHTTILLATSPRNPQEIIDWNIEHSYHYDLIVGDLQSIRKYVYDHARRPSPPSYKFEKDRRGWHYVNATDTGWPIQGELNVLLEQDDPQLHGPVGFWQAADASTLVIQAASHTRGSDARVFWTNLGDIGFSEKNSLGFTLNSDGNYHTYRVKLTDSRTWRGQIVQLRFDPVGTGGKGEWIRIKSMTFENEPVGDPEGFGVHHPETRLPNQCALRAFGNEGHASRVWHRGGEDRRLSSQAEEA